MQLLKKIREDRLSWAWLAAGCVFLPFTAWQTVIPLAGWLAPVFLLRFCRTTKHPLIARSLVFLAYAGAAVISHRGAAFSPLGFLGNIVFKGFVFSLPYGIDRLLTPGLKGWVRSLTFPLAFTTLDWILSILKISNTGSPAYSQAGSLALLQVVSVTGMWGITFLIMWCAALVNELWQRGFDWRPMRTQLGVFSGVITAALIFGTLRLAFTQPATDIEAATVTARSRTVAEAIGSVDWATFNSSTDGERQMVRPRLETTVDEMMGRTETALRGGAGVVGWQESSAWVLEEDRQGAVDRAAALAREHGAYLQISLEVFTRTPRPPYLRNQSILIDPAGTVLWCYDKTHPVIFDEAFMTIPGAGRLPVIDTLYGRWSTAICADTYDPALVRQAGAARADILFAPANDSRPLAGSALAIACFRAIENGFSMLRPAGNGISAVIDAQGRVMAAQDSFTNDSGIMIASLPMRGVRTLYSLIGDAFAWLGAAGLLSLSAAALFGRRRKAGEARVVRA